MTRGRGSSYVSVVGGLSLVVVTLSLYLSPLGATSHHSKIEATARTNAGAAEPRPHTGPPAHEHSPKAATVKALTKSPVNRAVAKEVVYIPTPGASSSKSSTTTTTRPPSI